MIRNVLVTGATGHVGSSLVPLLAARSDCAVTAMTRDPGSVGQNFPAQVQVVSGSFEDEASLIAAMRGIHTVVLIAPPNPGCVQQNRAVIKAAKSSGVEKLIRRMGRSGYRFCATPDW